MVRVFGRWSACERALFGKGHAAGARAIAGQIVSVEKVEKPAHPSFLLRVAATAMAIAIIVVIVVATPIGVAVGRL
jgi:hypothetical protein